MGGTTPPSSGRRGTAPRAPRTPKSWGCIRHRPCPAATVTCPWCALCPAAPSSWLCFVSAAGAELGGKRGHGGVGVGSTLRGDTQGGDIVTPAGSYLSDGSSRLFAPALRMNGGCSSRSCSSAKGDPTGTCQPWGDTLGWHGVGGHWGTLTSLPVLLARESLPSFGGLIAHCCVAERWVCPCEDTERGQLWAGGTAERGRWVLGWGGPAVPRGRSSWRLSGQEATWCWKVARGTLCLALKGQVASLRATPGLFCGGARRGERRWVGGAG